MIRAIWSIRSNLIRGSQAQTTDIGQMDRTDPNTLISSSLYNADSSTDPNTFIEPIIVQWGFQHIWLSANTCMSHTMHCYIHDIILVSYVVHDTWYCIRSGFTQGCLTCSNWPQTIFAEQLLPSELKTWQNNILSCGEAFDTYFFNCCQFLSQCLEKVNSSMFFSRFVCLCLVFLIFLDIIEICIDSITQCYIC